MYPTILHTLFPYIVGQGFPIIVHFILQTTVDGGKVQHVTGVQMFVFGSVSQPVQLEDYSFVDWKCANGPAGRYVSGHEHLQIVDRNEIVSKCILQINCGKFQEADATLSQILKKEPTCYQALVARGTCRALAGSTSPSELKKADSDFSKALVQMPLLADVWKRRSQARAALGNTDGAAKDLEECLAKCAASPAVFPCARSV